MKKTFFKSVVATAVVTAAVALSGATVFAADASLDLTDTEWAANSTNKTKYTSNDGVFEVRHNGTASGATGYKFDKNTKTDVTADSQTSSYYIKFYADAGDKVVAYVNCGSTGKSITADLIYDENGDGKFGYTEVFSSKTATVNKTDNTAYEFDQITKSGEYCLINNGNSAATAVFKGIEIKAGTLTGTQYDEELFGDATTDNTVTKVDTTATAVESLVGTDVLNAAISANEEFRTDSNGNVTTNYLLANGTYASANGNIVLDTTTSNKIWCDSETGLISMGGSKRQFTVTLAENQAIVLRGYGAASSGRNLTIDNVPYEAPTTAADTVLTVSAAGTYTVVSSANVYFTAIDIVNATEIAAPSITLAQTTVDDSTKVAFKGVISGSADDSIPVTAINVVTAKGYDASAEAVAAKTHSITSVGPDGSDYAFIVTIDKTAVNALPGLKIQASVDYDNNGTTVTSYSDVVTYSAE